MRWIGLALSLGAVGLFAAGCGGAQLHPFGVPSSSMEPTLNCARPGPGCLGNADDQVLVQEGKPVKRGDIVVFQTPRRAATVCGAGGLFIKRIVGLPGETVSEDGLGFISINGRRFKTVHASARVRAEDTSHYNEHWQVPAGDYFVVGDNLPESCDSRQWGGVPAKNIIGPVVKIVRGG